MLAASNGHDKIVTFLLDAGAAFEQQTKEGATALILAANGGHAAVLELLLNREADVNRLFNKGWTALHFAAQNGHISIVDRLIAAGADHDQALPDSRTGLILAAQNGHDAVVASLLACGANVNRVADDGTSGLILAAENGHDSVAARLLDAGANIEHACIVPGAAAGSDNSEKVVTPEDFHSNVDARPVSDGRTALIAAAKHGHSSIVSRLLAVGAMVNKTDLTGTTALMAACRSRSRAAVECLLNAGADCNLADDDGWTALTRAVNGSDEEITMMLIERGADLSKRNNNGQNAIDIAYAWEHTPIIERILAAGAKSPSVDELERARSHLHAGINIGLVVNARGKVCLVYDNPFPEVPVWVGYHVDLNRLEIFFETGGSYLIDWTATDEIRKYLLEIKIVLMIRMENRKPVEGYDTSFLLLEGRKLVE